MSNQTSHPRHAVCPDEGLKFSNQIVTDYYLSHIFQNILHILYTSRATTIFCEYASF